MKSPSSCSKPYLVLWMEEEFWYGGQIRDNPPEDDIELRWGISFPLMNHLTTDIGAYSAFKSLLGQLYQVKYNDVSNLPYSDLLCHTSVNNHTLNTQYSCYWNLSIYTLIINYLYIKRLPHTEKGFLCVKNNKIILLFIKIDPSILKEILQHDVRIKGKFI